MLIITHLTYVLLGTQEVLTTPDVRDSPGGRRQLGTNNEILLLLLLLIIIIITTISLAAGIGGGGWYKLYNNMY